MKFKIRMKDPNGTYYSVNDAAEENKVPREDIEKIMQRWFKNGEYVTLEIDSEKMTCVVEPLFPGES